MLSPVDLLRRFNDKADWLATLRFTVSVQAGEPHFTIHYDDIGGITVVREGPDDEAIDAFLLTYRMFVQPRDGISLWQIAALYPTLPVAPTLKQGVVATIAAIDRDLAATCVIQHGPTSLTRKDVHDAFLYGDKAHMNAPHKAIRDTWVRHQDLNALMTAEFVDILQVFLGAIMWMRDANVEALQALA